MNATIKGSLSFIGLGLYDSQDMSLRARTVIDSCEILFMECYTSALMGESMASLEQAVGKSIRVLTREETENADLIITAAREHDVGFLVGGDSMSATTHVDLRLRAIQEHIPTRLIFGTTILSAVPSLLGLQHYKFGRTTTLVYAEKGYFPTSPYDMILKNKSAGLHSLILLDIQADRDRYMSALEAIDILERMESMRQQQLIDESTVLCVIGQAGSKEPIVKANTIQQLKQMDFGPPLHTLVLPGSLHFIEITALEILAQLPASLGKKLQKI